MLVRHLPGTATSFQFHMILCIQAVLDRPSTNETALPLQVSIESSRGMVKTIEE